MKKISFLVMALLLSACQNKPEVSGKPNRPECIAPAKPGGGFDLTCKLAQSAFKELNILKEPMRVSYLPGGVGAVAYNKIAGNDRKNDQVIVAFSTGSLLNLSQGKFGKFDEKSVRWLAAVGADYGAVAVNSDSPYQNLNDLVKSLKENPKAIAFGAGGSVGGQDWLQTALLAKTAGIDPKSMSYVAMEGGGEAVTAVLGNHVQVVSSGIAEVMPYVKSGKLRVLAVFAPERLAGEDLQKIPTAKEQGYEIEWPVIRGYYLAPEVSDNAYKWWLEQFDALLSSPEFAKLRAQRDLLPFSLTGEKLTQYIYQRTNQLRELSKEFGLIK